MVRILTIFLLIFITVDATEFEQNCLKCHGKDFKFQIFLNRYTLKYSSKEKIKEAIFSYLKEPTSEKSILPLEYIEEFGLKEKSPLDDVTLRRMVDIYYDKFNVQSRLY